MDTVNPKETSTLALKMLPLAEHHVVSSSNSLSVLIKKTVSLLTQKSKSCYGVSHQAIPTSLQAIVA